jgi:hypothetical protein
MTTLITTNILSRNTRRFRTMWMAVAAPLLLTAFVGSAAAQSAESTDRDNPIRLTSSEISVPMNPDRDIYYTFMAGPGEVTMTLNVLRVHPNDTTSTGIELFDSNAKPIPFKDGRIDFPLSVYGGFGGLNEQAINRVDFKRPQLVLMRIKLRYHRGTVRLRLNGAVELGQATAPASSPQQETLFVLPARGAMQVEMNDGTVQRISLSEVRRVTVRQ